LILQKSIQEVLETARIEDVVGDFVNLKRRGANLAGLCPFHNEKSPSFYVSPSKNICKCFGCGKGGNPVQFIMEHETLSFPEAVRYLAKKYRIELEETAVTAEYQQEQQQMESLYLVNQFAHDFFQQQLFDTDKGRSVGLSYFKQRGFREETIRKFGLGFAPVDRDALLKAGLSKGYSVDLMKQLGLVSQYDRDFFRERVMFSIHNLTGKIIAFAGRIMSKDPKQPKYVNSPETEVYHKSRVLYGMYFAKKMIRQLDECYLVEGYTDVISLHQSGIENVVASSGTSLTPEQVRLIKRYTNNIKILYDGDSAGVKAALRGLDIVLDQDMNVRLVVLPEGEDPDSYIQKVGVNDFNLYLKEKAKDIVLFETELLLQEAGKDPTRRAEVLSQVAKTIAKVKNPLRRDEYVKTTRELLQVDEGKLLMEINRLLRKDIEKYQQKEELEQIQVENLLEDRGSSMPQLAEYKLTSGDEFQEKDITRILICGGEKWFDTDNKVTIAAFVLANVEDLLPYFDNELYRQVVMEYRSALQQSVAVSADFFINHSDKKINELALQLMTSPYEYSENWEKKWEVRLNQKHPDDNFTKDAERTVKHLRFRKFGRLIAETQAKIKALGPQEEQQLMLLLMVDQKLKSDRNALAKELGIVVIK
jgi:DNA primase